MTIGGSLVTLSESVFEKSTYYYDYSLSNFAYSLIVLKYFCYQNYGITEISNLLHISQRKASNLLHEALRNLAIYFGYMKVRNTIKGQGAKKMEIKKVSTMGS